MDGGRLRHRQGHGKGALRVKVRFPRLLDSSLGEVRRLKPTSGSVTLHLTGVSEASLSLPDAETPPAMHSLVEVYTVRGSAGIFRVTNLARTYRNEISVTLRHGIDTLSDSLWRAQETFTGTMTEYLTRLLSFQTARVNGAAPWVLGTCACATQITAKQMNYERLSDLLAAVEADETDYCFTYDQTSFPWTLSMIAKPNTVTAAIRLHRNAKGLTVTLDDSEMCNRLRLSANRVNKNQQGQKTDVDIVYKDYENATSQATWGIVEKVADIEVTEDIKNGAHAECDAWAARFLAERADPAVQIEVEGRELRADTGDPWDEPDLGQLARVELPDYGTTLTERVVSLSWNDIFDDARDVKVSLSNVLPKFSETLAQIRESAARAGRAASRAARDSEISGYWDMVVREIEPAVTGTGIKTLWETGIVLDAQSGATIYSLMGGLTALNTVLKVTHNGMNSVASVGGVQLNDDGTVALDENNNPIWLPGNNLYSRISQNATSITQEVTNRQNADSQLSGRIQTNADNISIVVEENDGTKVVKRAAIVASINSGGSSAVKIEADQVDVTGILTASGLITQAGYAGTIAATTFKGTTLNGITGEFGTLKLAAGSSYDTVSRNGFKIDGVTQNDTILMVGSTVLDIPATYIKEASVSNNTLTLTKADGTTVNFSKATTLSGAWSGGVLTVTASPQGSHYYEYLSKGTVSWDGNTASVPVTHCQSQSGTFTNTGYTVTVDASARYTAGETAGAAGVSVDDASGGALTGSAYDTDSAAWVGTVPLTIDLSNGDTDSRNIQINVQNAIDTGVGQGWNQALAKVAWPEAGANASFDVSAPASAWNTDETKTFTLSQSGSDVLVNDGTNDVAKLAVSSGSYAFSCPTTAAGNYTGSISGYLNCGAISKSAISAQTYIRFRIKCDNAYKYCYITVNV